MKKFEYLHLIFNNSIGCSTDKEMNKFGKNGWEAYAIKEVSNDRIQVFFKREINN